jgi:hypothetical protein
MSKCNIVFLAAGVLSVPAVAHHGFGRFMMDTDVEYSGTLVSIELVNPHSYMNLEVIADDGELLEMGCEMRAAVLIKRSGWSEEMFVPGLPVQISGHPHRDDPKSCYIESFTLGDGPRIDRNDQFISEESVDFSNRPLRLANGEINLTADWAVEQAVLTIPPEGGNGALVPRSVRDQFASGEITIEEIRARSPRPAPPVYTALGRAQADAFEMWSLEDNPRLSCNPTSIIFDWTFDWPINRLMQRTDAEGNRVIDISYGLYSFDRRIHVGMDTHPEDLEPGYAGHSIGRWEGDTLVVDTIGFEAGVLVPPTRNSEQMRIIERFTLDPETQSMTREYVVTDPVYLAEPYTGQDIVLLSETPFEQHPCEELTFEFAQESE